MSVDTKLPSVEALESAHQFPCEFTFKVIGKYRDDFVSDIVKAVSESLGMLNDPDFSTRETPGKKHISITLEIFVESAEDVREVYAAILKVKEIEFLI